MFAQVYKNKETKKWEKEFEVLSALYAPETPIQGAVAVDMLAIMPRPKWMNQFLKRENRYKYGTGRSWHDKKPDEDNIRKSVKDAMTEAKFWDDDCQVCCGETFKAYGAIGEEPCIYVLVYKPKHFNAADKLEGISSRFPIITL